MSCYSVPCPRPAVYRVKTVGAEFEGVSCGVHLVALINLALDHTIVQQGERVQLTKV